MLIPYFTDKLLQNILHGNNAVGAAVFVAYHRHMAFFALQKLKQRAYFYGLRNKNRLFHNIVDIYFRIAYLAVKIVLMNYSYNAVHRFFINGKSGISAFRKYRRYFLFCRFNGNRYNINTRSCNISRIVFVKLHCVFDKFAFLLADSSAVLNLFNKRKQFFFGKCSVIFVFERF